MSSQETHIINVTSASSSVQKEYYVPGIITKTVYVDSPDQTKLALRFDPNVFELIDDSDLSVGRSILIDDPNGDVVKVRIPSTVTPVQTVPVIVDETVDEIIDPKWIVYQDEYRVQHDIVYDCTRDPNFIRSSTPENCTQVDGSDNTGNVYLRRTTDDTEIIDHPVEVKREHLL